MSPPYSLLPPAHEPHTHICRLRADLVPYLTAPPAAALVEVIIDKNRPVMLRLADRSTRVLPYCIDLVEALVLLEAARHQWQLQHRVQSDDEDDFSNSYDGGSSSSYAGSSSSSSDIFQQRPLPDVYAPPEPASQRHARDFAGMFRADGRMGVPGTLHRISVLRNADGVPVGLTYRLGRHVPDAAARLGDVLSMMKASIVPGSPMQR